MRSHSRRWCCYAGCCLLLLAHLLLHYTGLPLGPGAGAGGSDALQLGPPQGLVRTADGRAELGDGGGRGQYLPSPPYRQDSRQRASQVRADYPPRVHVNLPVKGSWEEKGDSAGHGWGPSTVSPRYPAPLVGSQGVQAPLPANHVGLGHGRAILEQDRPRAKHIMHSPIGGELKSDASDFYMSGNRTELVTPQERFQLPPTRQGVQKRAPPTVIPGGNIAPPEALHWGAPSEQSRKGYQYNCTNIDQIAIKRKLGHGVTKQVYLGLHGGKKVAVKMVTRNVIDVTSCVKRLERERSPYLENERAKCFIFPNSKLMKEILLMQQLEHPNLLRMLGYCVRSEETESTSLEEHGVAAVYEYGLRFYLSTLHSWPLQLRLRTALELADLLVYLQHSPLGSLRVSDFKEAHFLLKDGRIKLTDLDDVTSMEPSCSVGTVPPTGQLGAGAGAEVAMAADGQGPSLDPTQHATNISAQWRLTPLHAKSNLKPVTATSTRHRGCEFGLKCVGGICPGHNAKYNLRKMTSIFFKNLIFLDNADGEANSSNDSYVIARMTRDLERLSIDAGEVRHTVYRLLDVPYITGYT